MRSLRDDDRLQHRPPRPGGWSHPHLWGLHGAISPERIPRQGMPRDGEGGDRRGHRPQNHSGPLPLHRSEPSALQRAPTRPSMGSQGEGKGSLALWRDPPGQDPMHLSPSRASHQGGEKGAGILSRIIRGRTRRGHALREIIPGVEVRDHSRRRSADRRPLRVQDDGESRGSNLRNHR